MALQWDWKDKMGKMTIKQRDGKKFVINIYKANCLGLFIYEYKDENKQDMYQVWSFLMDKQHVKNILKNKKSLFGVDVLSAELNLWYKNAPTLLDIFVKQGIKVKCYYKEIKSK